MSVSRREFIRNLSLLAGAFALYSPSSLLGRSFSNHMNPFSAEAFGKDFVWGAACAAFQTEGAWNIDGKGLSIWDTFSDRKGKIKDHENARIATDFYHRFPEDIDFLKNMNFNAFRFSLSWSRLMPNGSGQVNQKGIDYYNRIIDYCLDKGITPWITLYHWDLPQALEDKGGWTNRDILGWFTDYCKLAANQFGDRVKHWIVLNGPMGFTSFGYLLGIHAPGKRGMQNFLPAVHHAALCQSAGAKMVKNLIADSEVGSTFSCSPVEPYDSKPKNLVASKRLDAALNRLFIEPALGMGYPTDTLPFLKKMEKYFKPGDEDILKVEFDFIGLQYYFRVVAHHSLIPPLFVNQVKPEKRNVPLNSMKLEVYPEGISLMLDRFSSYQDVKKIYITESGVCYDDMITKDGCVHDAQRTDYFKSTLQSIVKAKNKGIPVEGYFAWSLTDNFEWKEGFYPRFGLVYVDYPTQQRIMKDSGKWFREFLSDKY